MVTAITFFIILSILILIHEFGHYYVAKKSGMLVEEFGFGLPPRLFGIKKGETLYSLNLLPFGGFVKIFGEHPDDLKKRTKDELDRAFSRKPWFQRAAVIIAGPLMNFILAVAVISFMFSRGVYLPSEKVTVVEVTKSSPAAEAGLRKDDVIVSMDGERVDSVEKMVSLSKAKAGNRVEVRYERNGDRAVTSLVPRQDPPRGQGALGVVITDMEIRQYPWYQAPFVGIRESVRVSVLFYQELFGILGKFITFQRPEVEVAGPVGIARLTGQAVESGPGAVFQLLGLLSLNLALINIIPFPALDGGQLSFVMFEAVSGRKINEKVKARINALGFALLMLLIFLITVKDIRSFF